MAPRRLRLGPRTGTTLRRGHAGEFVFVHRNTARMP